MQYVVALPISLDAEIEIRVRFESRSVSGMDLIFGISEFCVHGVYYLEVVNAIR